MSEKASYRINISPLQLMGFTIAMAVLIMGMVYATSSLILNGQKASAQTNQSNSASSPQYMLAEDGTSCVDPQAQASSKPTGTSASQVNAVGHKMHMNGKVYTVVGLVGGSQSNQDNDTTTTSNTTNSYSTVTKNNGNTDSRYSGNSLTDNRNSGNTDSRFSGNSLNANINSGNTTTKSTRTQTTTVDSRNSGNTETTTNVNTNVSDNGNTSNSGNTNNQNNGNTNNQNSGNSAQFDDPIIVVL